MCRTVDVFRYSNFSHSKCVESYPHPPSGKLCPRSLCRAAPFWKALSGHLLPSPSSAASLCIAYTTPNTVTSASSRSTLNPRTSSMRNIILSDWFLCTNALFVQIMLMCVCVFIVILAWKCYTSNVVFANERRASSDRIFRWHLKTSSVLWASIDIFDMIECDLNTWGSIHHLN